MSLDSITLYFVATHGRGAAGGHAAVLWPAGEQFRAEMVGRRLSARRGVSVGVWAVAGNMLGETLSLALNAVGFLACGMVWNASRVFHGRKPNFPGARDRRAGLGRDRDVARSQGSRAAPDYRCCDRRDLRGADRHRIVVGAAQIAAAALARAHGARAARRGADAADHPRRSPASRRRRNSAPASGSRCSRSSSMLYAVGTVFVIFMLVSERTVTVHKNAASVDPLTGMFNRRGFAEACARVIEREAKAGRPVTVLIFDIDHFKSINDRFGHPAGDELLKLFATIVVTNLRHQRSLGPDRRRGVRGTAAVSAGRGRGRGRKGARGLRGVRHRLRAGAGRHHRQHRRRGRARRHRARGAAGVRRHRALPGQARRP